MKRRKLLYIICIVVLVMLNSVYVDYEFFIALLVALFIPAVSWLMFRIARIGLKVFVYIPKDVITYNESVKLDIKAVNACPIPITRGRLSVRLQYSNTPAPIMISVPVEPMQMSEKEREVEVNPLYCGIITLAMDEFEGYDFIGLFKIKKIYKGSKSITVMPELIIPESEKNRDYDDESEEYQFSVNCTDNSEVIDLKKYTEGDPLNRIHWKLSVKNDELIVREYGEPVIKQEVILIDLTLTSEPDFRKNLDKIYQMAYSIGHYYVSNHKNSEFMAWNETIGVLEEMKFEDQKTFMSAFLKLMGILCSKHAMTSLEDAIVQNQYLIKEQSIVITAVDYKDSRYTVINVAKDDMQEAMNMAVKVI